ncbi:hypothetical protein M3Y98_01187000 [Aphelenchoides besseyi]|nr:hypothetical protein M3Y98_01187000 [Aphelenchoides besseyi]KAI6195258.1 hypothetical protein M3Y96_01211700 [Aphelenchoides besseyi]
MDELTLHSNKHLSVSHPSSPQRHHLIPRPQSRSRTDSGNHSSGKSTPTFSFGRRTPTPSGERAEGSSSRWGDRARLPVRMMRRVKVAALPGTSHSDDNSRATTPSLDHLNEHYTKSEIEDYRQLFSMFDTDGSGAIGNEELKQAIISIGMQASDKEIDDLIKEVDEDGNGEIDFSEFCHCLKRSQNIVKSSNEEMVRQCFNIFDQDGNGVITENEFMYIAKEVGGFDDELAEYVFHQLDVSSNGHLSTDQFAAIVEDYLLSDQSRVFEQEK